MIELLLQAERLLSVGLLDKAEQLYSQVARADPKNSIAVVGLARVTLDRGDDEGALELARRALAIDPENAAAQRMVARLEEVLEYRESAESLLFDRADAVSTLQAEVAADVAAEVGAVAGEAAVAEPGVVAATELAGGADVVEPEVAAEAEVVAEPEVAAEAEVAAEPEVVAEPEVAAEPEPPAGAEPAVAAEAAVAAEPDGVAEPAVAAEPWVPAEPGPAEPEPVEPDVGGIAANERVETRPEWPVEDAAVGTDLAQAEPAHPEAPDVTAVPVAPADPWTVDRPKDPGPAAEPDASAAPEAPDVTTEPRPATEVEVEAPPAPLATVWAYLERLFRRQ